MDLVAWAAWAWIPGIVGLLVALLLVWLRRRSTAAPAVAEAADRIHAAAKLFFRRELLVLALFIIIAAALLGLATSLLTAAACLSGAICAVIVFLLSAHAAGRGSIAAAATLETGEATLGSAFGGGAVGGLALVSLALIGLGLWYFAKGAGAITDEDFMNFAHAVAGFAFGAAGVALFARITGGMHTAAARLAGSATPTPDSGLAEEDARSAAVQLTHTGRIVGDVAGTSAGLFESLAGAAVAAIVVGASAQIYSASRGAAVALPVLTVLVSMLTSLVALGLARVLQRQAPGAALRNLTIACTVVFLVLEYVVVKGLHFSILDPTGARVYRPDAPFLAILTGSVVGLIISALSERALGARSLGRWTEQMLGGVTDGLGAALEATAIPAFLVACAIWLSYYVAGIYGIGLATLGLVGTAGIALAVNACGAVGVNAAALAGLAGAAPEAGTRAEGLAAPGRRALAIGKGATAAGAGLAAISLFIAYVSASGAELGGLLLLDSALLSGLVLGALVSFLVAGLVVRGTASTGSVIAAEAGRQLREVKGLQQGRTGPDLVGATNISAPAALWRTLAPGLLIVLVPVAAGMLDLELLSGLLVGAILAGLLLALFFGHSSVVAEAAYRPAPEAAGAASPGRIGPWQALAGPFADAAAPALGTAMKFMAATSLVLAPWFVRLHGASILQEGSLREGARQLLALLGR